MLFYLFISYFYSLHNLNWINFLYDNSSFKRIHKTQSMITQSMITQSMKFHRNVSCALYNFYSKTYYLKHRLDRISVRIWLYSVATNFNIISQEYDNRKDGIFLDVLFLTLSDFLVYVIPLSPYINSPERAYETR